MSNLGGITMENVIVFQTKVIMGAQFNRVIHAKRQEDIMIACLRMGWNDAFRHTSQNVRIEQDGESKKNAPSVLELKEKEWRCEKKHTDEYDDFICANILSKIIVIFKDYACAGSTVDKIGIIGDKFEDLKGPFEGYKKTEGDLMLCFGHFQKMFNIAIKLYVCLYLCRKQLGIKDKMFNEDILNNIKNADCPIDSIILDGLAKDSGCKEYRNHKWSKYGTDKNSTDDYKNVQETISQLEDVKGKSNLFYDFIAWKNS